MFNSFERQFIIYEIVIINKDVVIIDFFILCFDILNKTNERQNNDTPEII